MHFTTIKAQILYSERQKKLTLNFSRLFKYFRGIFKILVFYSKKFLITFLIRRVLKISKPSLKINENENYITRMFV